MLAGQITGLQLDPQNLCTNGKKEPSLKNMLPSLHMHSLACMPHTHNMLTLPQLNIYLTAFLFNNYACQLNQIASFSL